jgi:hypothetical protein
MKPPCKSPKRARQVKKLALPLSQNWDAATTLQRHMMVGIYQHTVSRRSSDSVV